MLRAAPRQTAASARGPAPPRASRRLRRHARALAPQQDANAPPHPRSSFVVVGAGPIGWAVARHLLKEGASKVVVVDGRAAGLGSSHADRARLLRSTDAEGDATWSRRNAESLAAFEGIEAQAGRRFFTRCGALIVGPNEWVARAKGAAERAGAGGSLAEVSNVAERWPFLAPVEGCRAALFDGNAGYIEPLAMIEAFHAAASAGEPSSGALEVVPGVAAKVAAGEVELESGVRLTADHVVVCGGPLSRSLLAGSGGEAAQLLGGKGALRVSRRTVALLEVSEGTAAGMLAAMPTIKYAYNLPAAGGEGASGGEQSRVESGSVYILPPVRYPERGGRLFVKLGGGPNDFFKADELESREAVDTWLDSEGDAASAASLERVLRLLMPTVPFLGEAESKACVTTLAPSGDVEVAHAPGGGLSAVSACQGKGAGPADAIGREVARALTLRAKGKTADRGSDRG